jgi:hypothetical protein
MGNSGEKKSRQRVSDNSGTQANLGTRAVRVMICCFEGYHTKQVKTKHGWLCRECKRIQVENE